MKFRWDNRYLHWGVTAFSGNCRQYAVLLWHISHENPDRGNQKLFLGIMAPIIYGVILAYILSPLINLFEQKLIYPQLEKHNIKLQKKENGLFDGDVSFFPCSCSGLSFTHY